MELRQIEAFLMVAEELHFGRAAERLHIAQPALSRLVSALERELGVPLFERTTRRVGLTSSGEAMLGPAREIQVQVDGVRRVARSAQAGDIGRVRVGFAGAAGYVVASTLAHQVASQYPAVTLQLDPRSFSGEAANALIAGELDLAVITLPPAPGISAHKVSDEPLVAAVPQSDPLSERETLEVADLRDRAFVSIPATHGSRVREAMVTACTQAGFSPKIVQEAPDTYSLLALIGAGVGASIVAASARKIQVKGVRYVPFGRGLATLPIALGWRDSNPSAALARVVQIARETFPDSSDGEPRG